MVRGHALISGAGIAGPALALWLDRFGYRTTVVERAPALREGGQAVDFRGPIHRNVLERMNLWNAIHARRTVPQALALLDANGSARATLPAVMMSGDVEILRGDLCRLLYERTSHSTEYRFADRITRLENRPGHVAVEFEHAPPQSFDFVIGADGLHSGVRALAFAPEAEVLRHHGYRIASFATPSLELPRGLAQLYSVPGRGVCLSNVSTDGTRALLVDAAPPFDEARRDPEGQKRALLQTFRGLGWRVPQVLAELDDARDLYVDSIASVHVDRYSNGRIGLLGDAAYGGTLGGQGTSLAIVGAYVLAGELASAPSPRTAFARYEAALRPYATRCQKGALRAGPFFAPRTRFGLFARNVMYSLLTSKPCLGFFEWLVKDAAESFRLPEYAPTLLTE